MDMKSCRNLYIAYVNLHLSTDVAKTIGRQCSKRKDWGWRDNSTIFGFGFGSFVILGGVVCLILVSETGSHHASLDGQDLTMQTGLATNS